MTLKQVAEKLTWYTLSEYRNTFDSHELYFGVIGLDTNGDIYELGDYCLKDPSETDIKSDRLLCEDVGCGCCSNCVNIVKIAFLSELIKDAIL